MHTILLLLMMVEFLPNEIQADEISYVSNILVNYMKGSWISGEMNCPADTFGCSIRRKNDGGDRIMLHTVYACLDKQKKTYTAASSSYIRSYGVRGETVYGVVPLNK